MDIDHFPGSLTWIGTFLVLIGVLGIQKAERQRKQAQSVIIVEGATTPGA